MSTTIDHFDHLTNMGLKVIPLRENSKKPMYKGWNNNWDKKKARDRLERFPDANIGLLLGDVIDVEGDSEEANRTILRLVRNYPHPCYKSIRSIHHLFITPDPTLRILKVGELEFRGHGHQSVLPPSSHYGFQYQWAREQFPIPEMPEPLLLYYKQHKDGNPKKQKKPGHIRCWCDQCGNATWRHHKRHAVEVEAFQLLESKWLCDHCRDLDIRSICRMIQSGVARDQILINTLQQF